MEQAIVRLSEPNDDFTEFEYLATIMDWAKRGYSNREYNQVVWNLINQKIL